MPLITAFCLSSTFCLLSLWKPGGHLLRKRCPLGFIWDMSWQNLFLPYANNKGADQPAYPRCLISAFVGCCLDSIIPILAIDEISSLYLASVSAQAGLSLPWSQTLKTGFLMTWFTWCHPWCLCCFPVLCLGQVTVEQIRWYLMIIEG